MQQMIANNPQYQQAYNELKQNGGTLKEAFLNRAKELGIDAEQIISMLK